MTYMCPVCGYDQLPEPPEDYLICSSCGTEFGYEDLLVSHAVLRRRWLARGAPWFAPPLGPPPGWNAHAQLLKAGLAADVIGTPPTLVEAGTDPIRVSARIA